MCLGQGAPDRQHMHDRKQAGAFVPVFLSGAIIGKQARDARIAETEAGRLAGRNECRDLPAVEHLRQGLIVGNGRHPDFGRKIGGKFRLASALFQSAGAPVDIGRRNPIIVLKHAPDPERGRHRVDRHADFASLEVFRPLDPGIGADIKARMPEHTRRKDRDCNVVVPSGRPGEDIARPRQFGHVELVIVPGPVEYLFRVHGEVVHLAPFNSDPTVHQSANPVVWAGADRQGKAGHRIRISVWLPP